jgi:hypothetical protein
MASASGHDCTDDSGDKAPFIDPARPGNPSRVR